MFSVRVIVREGGVDAVGAALGANMFESRVISFVLDASGLRDFAKKFLPCVRMCIVKVRVSDSIITCPSGKAARSPAWPPSVPLFSSLNRTMSSRVLIGVFVSFER